MIQIQNVTVADVLSVYSGKPGCMCGCRGSHRYNPEHRAEGAKRRGYAVDDGDVNARQVAKVLRTLQTTSEKIDVDKAGEWFSAEIDGRLFCVYLTRAAIARLHTLAA